MNRKKKRFAAILTAGVLCLMLGTGCQDESSGGITLKEEDMEYGATMRLDKTSFAVPMQYDDRTLGADAVSVVANYYASVQNQDTELFLQTQLPLYHDYEMNTVYEGKYTDQELVEGSYAAWKERLGCAYVYSLVDIKDCTANRIYTTSAQILEMLDGLSQEADGSKISEQIDHFYEMTLDVYMWDASKEIKGEGYNSDENFVIRDQVLFLLQLDEQWYVIFT